jgi:hypothetical protein
MKIEELLSMDYDEREVLIDWAEAQAEQLEITVDYFIEEWM